MKDISLEVDASEIMAARRDLSGFGDEFAKMVSKVVQESNRMAQATKASTDIQNEAMNRLFSRGRQAEIDRQAAAVKKYNADYAAAVAENTRRTLEAEKAMKAEAARVQELTNKFNPLLAAVGRYERIQKELNEAFERGVIGPQRYKQALDALEAEMLQVQSGAIQAKNAFNQFGDFSGFAGAKVNRFGSYMQNAGYQVADFAVQVQNGTNVLVALGQQGSQILGIFGMWGAIAGAVLAVATSIGLVAWKMGEAGDKAEDLNYNLRDFEDLDVIFNSVGASIEDGLGGAIDAVEIKYGRLIGRLTEFDATKMIEGIRGANSGLVEGEAPGILDQMRSVAPMILGTGVGAVGGTNQDALEDQQRILDEMVSIVEQLDGLTTDEVADSWANVLEQIEGIDGITEELVNKFIQLGDETGVKAILQERATELAEEEARVAERAAEFMAEQTREMSDKLMLRQTELQYGSESVEYLALQQAIERDLLIAEMTRLQISAENQAVILEQVDAMNEMEIKSLNASAAAESLASWLGTAGANAAILAGIDIVSGISAAAGAAYSLASGLASAVAQANALNAARAVGISIPNVGGVAGAVNGALGGAYNWAMHNIPAPVPEGMTLPGNRPDDWTDMDGDGIPDPVNVGMERDAARAARAGGKGGGGGGSAKETDAEKAAKIMAELREELEFRESLIGKTEEERELLEAEYAIREKLGDKVGEISEAEIESLAKQQIAVDELLEAQEEAEQKAKQLADTLKGDFKDSIMSIVEGTESVGDAFRNMLRQMILDIYQQKMMDPYVEYAGNWLSKAFPAVMGGFASHASGGDVQSGMPIMVGERGRELFVPKSNGTIVPNHDLQNGGGSVQVTQNFHFTANGDESVRKIIRQEAPRLREEAKQAVLEARKRGGAYAKV